MTDSKPSTPLSPALTRNSGKSQKVTRVTFSPSLPPMRARDLKRYSPITDDERHRVEAAIGRLDPDTMTPERWQRLADALRRPLERVERAAMCRIPRSRPVAAAREEQSRARKLVLSVPGQRECD